MTPVTMTRLRARFAETLSGLYGEEVPAYTTLVEVSHEVNADVARAWDRTPNGWAASTGSPPNGTAPSASAHPPKWPRSPGSSLRWACHPTGFYDLRDASASAVPVVSTAFRPIDADELARNPFRVFTSLLATGRPAVLRADLRGRLETFLAGRELFAPRLLDLADRASAEASSPGRRRRFLPWPRSLRPVQRARRPGLVRRTGEGLRRRRRHRRGPFHAHQPPHPAGAGHRRALPPDDGTRHRDDRRDPGSTPMGRPRRPAAADLLPRTRRATAVPRPRRQRSPADPCGCGSARSKPGVSRSPRGPRASTTEQFVEIDSATDCRRRRNLGEALPDVGAGTAAGVLAYFTVTAVADRGRDGSAPRQVPSPT